MLEELTCGQFDEWLAFFTLGPWGPEREDLRAGLIASCVENSQKVKGKPSQPDDFFPNLRHEPGGGDGRARVRQSPAQMIAVAKALTVALGGKAG